MSPSDVTLRQRASLVAEVLVTYGAVRWSERRRDLPAVVAKLRAASHRRAPRGALDADDRRLADAAVRVLEHLPGDSRCLTQSLVVFAMLARREREVRLVLAARPMPTFAAHAWVERDGRALLPKLDFDDARLAEL